MLIGNVAPFPGAWIETLEGTAALVQNLSRALPGRVD